MVFQTSDSGVVNLLWQNWRGGSIGLEQVSTKYLLDVLRQYLCCFCHVLHRQILEAINCLFVTAVKSVTLSIGCSDVIGQHTFLRNLQVLVLLLLGRLQRSNLCAELTLDVCIGLSTS